MSEIVYILINEAMPGYVKIGVTTDLEQRMRSLDTTSMPLPFECFFAGKVENAGEVEKLLHEAFDDQRVRKNREFFEIAPERVVSALRIARPIDVTPGQDFVESADDQKALDKARSRRSAFNFDMVQIPIGAELIFVRDSEVSCIVVNTRKVEFEGDVMSTSAAADIALKRLGATWKGVQGPLYWEYQGETLDERRRRMEQDD